MRAAAREDQRGRDSKKGGGACIPSRYFVSPLIDSELSAVRFSYGGGTQDKKMSKGHLPRVVYHQVYNVFYDNTRTWHI